MKDKKSTGYSVLQNVMYALKNLWKWNKAILISIMVVMVTQTLMPAVGIYMPKYVIEYLQNGSELMELVKLVLIFTVLMLVLQMLLILSRNYMGAMGIINRLLYMELLSEKAIKTDYSNMASERGQTLLSKAFMTVSSNDSATERINSQFASIGKNIFGLVLYGTLIAVLNPVIIVILILGGVIVYFVGRAVNQYKFKLRDEKGRINKKFNYVQRASSDYSFAKDIRLYGMFEWLTSIFMSTIKDRSKWEMKVLKKTILHTMTEGIIAFLRDGLAYIYLIYLVVEGMAVSDFALYFGAITGFSIWVSGLAQDLLDIHQSSNDISVLREFIEMENVSNHDEGRSILPLKNQQLSIEFNNVTFTYPGSEEPIFNNFNLKLDANKNYAVVGVNGAGKTTLVKLLIGLYRPDEGQILINGIDSNEFNIDDYFSLFSVAFQDAVVTAFSLKENVTMKPPGEIKGEDIIPVLKSANLYEKVQSLPNGIDTSLLKELDTDGTMLSGGETQKLILARALFSDREILVLDEPSAALDPIAEADLYEKYHTMAENKTSIYISHRLSSTKFCDEIIFMEKGSVTERGSHRELMDLKGKYSEMFVIQSHYYQESIEVSS